MALASSRVSRMSVGIRHIWVNRWLNSTIFPARSIIRMPSAVDSSVDWRSEIVWTARFSSNAWRWNSLEKSGASLGPFGSLTRTSGRRRRLRPRGDPIALRRSVYRIRSRLALAGGDRGPGRQGLPQDLAHGLRGRLQTQKCRKRWGHVHLMDQTQVGTRRNPRS